MRVVSAGGDEVKGHVSVSPPVEAVTRKTAAGDEQPESCYEELLHDWISSKILRPCEVLPVATITALVGRTGLALA